MLLSNLKGALRQIRQEPEPGYEYGYVGRHRAPEEPDDAPTTRLPPITVLPPIVPGGLPPIVPGPVPSPRSAPAT